MAALFLCASPLSGFSSGGATVSVGPSTARRHGHIVAGAQIHHYGRLTTGDAAYHETSARTRNITRNIKLNC